MAEVEFTLRESFEAHPERVWHELTDWRGHARWIPATRVEVGPGDPTAVGATFTAWSGFGRVALEDRMRVVSYEWDAATSVGSCRVEKLGPILRGGASFDVRPAERGTMMVWEEDFSVPWVPQLLAPVLARLGAAGFRLAMRRLRRLMSADPDVA